MLGSPVPMVPLPGVAASALESYSRFLVSGRARDKEIELEREREREYIYNYKSFGNCETL